MRPHGVSAFALVLVTSFAIDRLVSGILFLGMWSGILTDPEKMAEGEERYKARRTYKAIYYAIAGALGIVVMASLGGIMLLTALLPADSSVTAAPIFRLLDIIVTGLALMGGAEKLPELLKIGKETGGAFASASTSESPIKVEGKLFRTNRDSASHDARILVRSTDRQRLGQNRESSRFGVLASSSPNRPTWTDLSISCRASFQADCQVRTIAATAAHSSRCSTRIASLKRTCMFRR